MFVDQPDPCKRQKLGPIVNGASTLAKLPSNPVSKQEMTYDGIAWTENDMMT